MSDYSDIAAALASLVTPIVTPAIVHARRRWNADWATFKDQVMVTYSGETDPRVSVWMIARESVAVEPGPAFNQVQRTHKMLVFGALSFDDGDDTYTRFQDTVDALLVALTKPKTLSLGDAILYGVGPPSARTIGEEALGSILCHVAEIELDVVTVAGVTYT